MAHNLVGVADIINDFLISTEGDDYAGNVTRTFLRQVALRGIREFGFDISGKVRSLKLSPETNGTYNLPDDFASIVRVGLAGSDGMFYPLAMNDNLNMSQAYTNVDDPVDSDGDGFFDRVDDTSGSGGGILGEEEALLFNNYAYNQAVGRTYGLGGGIYAGEYRLNRDQNRLETDSGTTGVIVVEYVADEARAKDPQVPVEAEEALRAYMYFRIIERKRGVPNAEKARARQEYYNERRKANARLRTFNKDEALRVIRKNFKQAPKY
jgi:hypothetical protein